MKVAQWKQVGNRLDKDSRVSLCDSLLKRSFSTSTPWRNPTPCKTTWQQTSRSRRGDHDVAITTWQSRRGNHDVDRVTISTDKTKDQSILVRGNGQNIFSAEHIRKLV